MKKRKIVYVEPADYFPEDVRRECKLGEFAERDDSKKDEKIRWYCDGCNAYLNKQRGFTTETGTWKCAKCGFINDVTESNILEENEWKEKERQIELEQEEKKKQIELEQESLKIEDYKQRAEKLGITLQEYLLFKNIQKMNEISNRMPSGF